MLQYTDPVQRRSPTFVALVLSICCLSSRYAQIPAAAEGRMKHDLYRLAKETIHQASDSSDLYMVQALFNMSVVQEGTARPNLLWLYLSQAIS